MTKALASKTVREWVGGRLEAYGVAEERAVYRLQHLDADSNVAQREQAKAQLAAATDNEPRGILNVGIFGEGTDAPSLSAVGFLEPRKSPVDVIRAVGRVMRRSEEKDTGYILCPIVIPPNVDAEKWLANTNDPDEGWQALGQILMALRAHDDRIEERVEVGCPCRASRWRRRRPQPSSSTRPWDGCNCCAIPGGSWRFPNGRLKRRSARPD